MLTELQGSVTHSGNFHVSYKGTAAQCFFVCPDFGIGIADTGTFFPNNLTVFTQGFGSQKNAIDNFYIPGASAHIDLQSLDDILATRVGVALKQYLCSGDHTRSTKTALHGTFCDKGPSESTPYIFREAFDCDN